METKNLIYGALATLGVGAAVYFLTRDGDVEVSFNPKVHTVEKLLPFLEDMHLDFRCIYVRVYNLILTMKASNQFKPQMLQDLQQ